MTDNPIFEVWQSLPESNGDLEAARQTVAARAKSGEITSDHINQIGAFLESEEPETKLPLEARIALAALLFTAAQNSPNIDDRLRFVAAHILNNAIPGHRRDLFRLKIEALQTALSFIPSDYPEQEKASFLNDIGSLYAQMGEPRPAQDYLQQALAIYRKLAEAKPDTFLQYLATTLNNLGNVLRDLGERAGAREKYEEALGIRREMAKEKPAAFARYVAETLNNLGTVLSDLGNRTGARAAYEEALGIRRQLAVAEPGAFEPDVAMTLNNLGTVLRALGDHEEALAACEEALVIYRRLAETDSGAYKQHVAGALNNLGRVLRALGDQGGAREKYREALKLAERAERPLLQKIKSNLAAWHYDAGEQDEGIALARETVEEIETMLSDPGSVNIRYSFKGEIEHVYRLLLSDPDLERDTLRAHRIIEALREGENLAGFGGWRSALLEIQNTRDGVLFLANLATGTVIERGDMSWRKASERLIDIMWDAGSTEDLAAAGRELWDTLPERIKDLFLSPPLGGISLSLDQITGFIPLELLNHSGKAEDFLCLKTEMPRVPGEKLFRDCRERISIDCRNYSQALVFGNPTKDLAQCTSEAQELGHFLELYGFTSSHNDFSRVEDEATKEAFLDGLGQNPSLIHFTGHGASKDQEECLVFAKGKPLYSYELRELKSFPNHSLVFLSSCQTGTSRSYGGAFRGLPIQFLHLGAATVIASAYKLYPVESKEFAAIFYGKLLSGESVGEVLLHTRQEMAAKGVDCIHWARPILYGNPHARLLLPPRKYL